MLGNDGKAGELALSAASEGISCGSDLSLVSVFMFLDLIQVSFKASWF